MKPDLAPVLQAFGIVCHNLETLSTKPMHGPQEPPVSAGCVGSVRDYARDRQHLGFLSRLVQISRNRLLGNW
jgi:hypothetical protein